MSLKSFLSERVPLGMQTKEQKRNLIVTILASLFAIAMITLHLYSVADQYGEDEMTSIAVSIFFHLIAGLAILFLTYYTYILRYQERPSLFAIFNKPYLLPVVIGLLASLYWLSSYEMTIYLIIGIVEKIVIAIAIVLAIDLRTNYISGIFKPTNSDKTDFNQVSNINDNRAFSWRRSRIIHITNLVILLVLTLAAYSISFIRVYGYMGPLAFFFGMTFMMAVYDREKRKEFSFLDFKAKHIRGLIFGVALGVLVVFLSLPIIPQEFNSFQDLNVYQGISYAINLTLVIATFSMTFTWMVGVRRYILESYRYGVSKEMPKEILNHPKHGYRISPKETGVYIGGGKYHYTPKGHMITIAGTRSGKGTNLIVPQLLGATDYTGSLVVLDPKGENTAITAHHQLSRPGRKVKILDPFKQLQSLRKLYPDDDRFAYLDELEEYIVRFNPMDILNRDSEELPDDAQMLAQMIVPDSPNAGKEQYFNDRARSMIAGILTHMATKPDKPTLNELWNILRAESVKPDPEDDNSPIGEWEYFLLDMVENDKIFDGIISKTGHEISSLEMTSEREAASVKSTARKWTDFLKSPLLRKRLTNEPDNFDPNTLSKGDTTLYIVIPADKLESHNAWLRLVVGACMKAVIRQPKEQVQFILDEFYALGYMSMVETAMGAYAGYNLRVWAIIQSLTQLRKTYSESGWENFIGNASVIHAFGINDNFTADYVSKMTGETSFPSYGSILGIPTGATPRNVFTSAQVRSLENEMLLFVDRKSVARLPFKEYWKPKLWPHKKNWAERSKPNPLSPPKP